MSKWLGCSTQQWVAGLPETLGHAFTLVIVVSADGSH